MRGVSVFDDYEVAVKWSKLRNLLGTQVCRATLLRGAGRIAKTGSRAHCTVVGVKPERLRELRSGMLDLRTLLLEAPGGEWYLTLVNGNAEQPLSLEPQNGPLAETDFLPDDGFLPVGDELDPKETQRRISLGKPAAVTGWVEIVNRIAGHWELSTGDSMTSGKLAPGTRTIAYGKLRCSV